MVIKVVKTFKPCNRSTFKRLTAQMAKLVDALPSGGSVRKDVQVRILFWAQMPFTKWRAFVFGSVENVILKRLQIQMTAPV